MSITQSVVAFADVKEVLDRALETERGITIEFDSKADVHIFHMRLNTYRKKDRKLNKETYPEDHPLHGASIYDRLVFRTNDLSVIIGKLTMSGLKIKEI